MLSSIGVSIIVATLIFFYSQLDKITDTHVIRYDKSIVGITHDISGLVPKGETLVVSSQNTFFKYFTGHPIVVPWGNTPSSLPEYMRHSNYHYLIVVENVSDVDTLKPLFSSSGLPTLDSNFTKIASYNSDIFRIHLYELKNTM